MIPASLDASASSPASWTDVGSGGEVGAGATDKEGWGAPPSSAAGAELATAPPHAHMRHTIAKYDLAMAHLERKTLRGPLEFGRAAFSWETLTRRLDH
jgi:hypothetical protein